MHVVDAGLVFGRQAAVRVDPAVVAELHLLADAQVLIDDHERRRVVGLASLLVDARMPAAEVVDLCSVRPDRREPDGRQVAPRPTW